MRVTVIGAGMGGLALAQALHRADVDVVVHDRDAHVAAPWPAGPVTALGDAVHAMPPTGGGAAATAIRDAGHLAAQLVAARDGDTTIPLATLRFQQTMAGYAPGRVREAVALLRSMQRSSGPLGSAAAGVVLPARYRLRRGGVTPAVTVGTAEHRIAS